MHLKHITGALSASDGANWNIEEDGRRVSIVAHGQSDIFVDPGRNGAQVTTASRHNAATLMTQAPSGDFQFQARVNVAFGAAFDAGVLLLRVSQQYWAKLCFEYSPTGEPMVVSVVNKGGTSDDANSFVVNGGWVDLRITRKDEVYALHASLDGSKWIFIRAFAWDIDVPGLEVGFAAQSPSADGCRVIFSKYALIAHSLADFRSGQ